MSKLKIAAAVIAIVALSACAGREKPKPGTSGLPVPSESSTSSSSSSSSSSGAATLTVVAVEPAPGRFLFDTGGVREVKAGAVDVTFQNGGTMPHELHIVRVRDGNFSAYQSAVIAQGTAGGASLGDELIGIDPVEPGKSAITTVTMTPGTYALVCFLNGTDGKAFAQQGMIAKLDVSAVS